MAYANPFGDSTAPGAVANADPVGLSGPAWTNWYLNNEPGAGWVQYLQNLGLYGLDPVSGWARNQYGKTYGQYTSAASQNPNLGFFDWLNNTDLNLKGQYSSLDPTSRGDFSDRSTTTKARFMRAY